MRATFSRMQPDVKNMVVQTNRPTDHQLLCAECGWEGSVVNLEAAESAFKVHPCRLVSESVSTSD